jgi:hypothetical protein
MVKAAVEVPKLYFVTIVRARGWMENGGFSVLCSLPVFP